jgi:hypothetical protein
MSDSSVAWSEKVWEKKRNVSHRRGISIAKATAIKMTIPAKTPRMLRATVHMLCITANQFPIIDFHAPPNDWR